MKITFCHLVDGTPESLQFGLPLVVDVSDELTDKVPELITAGKRAAEIATRIFSTGE